MKDYTIKIEGMHCEKCVARVTEALGALRCAKNVEVDLEGKCAKVSTAASAEKVKTAVEDLGFEVVELN